MEVLNLHLSTDLAAAFPTPETIRSIDAALLQATLRQMADHEADERMWTERARAGEDVNGDRVQHHDVMASRCRNLIRQIVERNFPSVDMRALKEAL